VRLALESGHPIAHAAADLGIHKETLRNRAAASSSLAPGAFVNLQRGPSPHQQTV
jgi:transposase-like protein